MDVVTHTGAVATDEAMIGRTMQSLGRRARGLFRIDTRQASFAARGFAATSAAKQVRLEHVGRTFLDGFNMALMEDDVGSVRDGFVGIADDDLGFAVEGAAMGFAVADAISLSGGRLERWLQRAGGEFTYLIHVGAGWALARTPWRRRAITAAADPVHGLLIYDGLGFHDAYFHPRRIADGWRRLTRGYAARVYDQGIGRALWFSSGADPYAAARRIAALDASRHADLWSGLALALAYAGPAESGDIERLRIAAGRHLADLFLGAAFAAEAHARAGCRPAHTVEAVAELCGLDVGDAVAIVRSVRGRLRENAPTAYERWRNGVRAELVGLREPTHA